MSTKKKSKQLSAAWTSPHGNRAHVTAHICFTLFFGLPTPTKRHFFYILVRESALHSRCCKQRHCPTKLLFSTYQVAWPTTSGLWESLNLLHSIISVRNLHVNINQLVVRHLRCRVAIQVKGNPVKMYNYLVAQRRTFAKNRQLSCLLNIHILDIWEGMPSYNDPFCANMPDAWMNECCSCNGQKTNTKVIF